MTVNSTTSRVSYAGNGTTTTFTVPFYFLAAADLVVIRTSSSGTQTTLVLSTDYTVSGAGNLAGGSITCTTAPASTDSLVIFRDPAATQLTDYQANDPFPAETHERALDKLTMIAQRVRDLVTRSFRLSDGDTSTASTTLPSPQANKLIGWNAAASGLQNVDAATMATVVAYGTTNADIFTGNGVATAFTLSANPGAQSNLDVSVGGVTQLPGTDYIWTGGTTLTFTTAPPNGVRVLARYAQALPQGTLDSASVTYAPAGTGAVSSNVKRKLDDRISVFDFMTPAEITDVQSRTAALDVTAALQAFFNACRGKRGYMPAGTYRKSQQITLDPQYSYDIEGDGWAVDYQTQGTIIKDTTNSNGLFIYYTLANTPSGPPAGTPMSDERVRIANLRLRGQTSLTATLGSQTINIEGVNTSVYTGAGVWMYWTQGLLLDNVLIDGYVGDGVYGYRCFSSTIKNCWIVKNNRCGVHLFKTTNSFSLTGTKALSNCLVPAPDINCNILIDGSSGYENLGVIIDGNTDVSYAGTPGATNSRNYYRTAAGPNTLTSIVVSAGVATANITGTNWFSAGDKLAVYGWLPTSVNAGSFQVGARYTIATLGTTDFTLIGAPSNNVGVVFTATGAGAGTGTATYTLNTSAPVTVTSATSSTIVFPLLVPDGTYTTTPLYVGPYVAGIGIANIQGIQIDAYAEQTFGPAIYVYGSVDGFTIRGGYYLDCKIYVESGARGGSIRGCAFTGTQAGIHLESELSAVCGENRYINDPARGRPSSFFNNLPVVEAGNIVLQGMMLGRGSDLNIDQYTAGPASNTGLGVGVLRNINTSGGGGQGLHNTVTGAYAGAGLGSGYNNSFFGRHAGLGITSGFNNVAAGNRAMDTGTNLQECVFIGNAAGSGQTSGGNDTYVGSGAGLKASAGASDGNNAGFGSNALRVNGSQNYKFCTIVGGQDTPMTAATGLINYTGLGYNTWSFAASNKVRVGDGNVTAAHVQVAWTVTSDARLKRDITDLDLGLALVNALRPVSYRRTNGDDTEELGFLAQEVQAALPRPLGMLHVDADGTYMLRKDDLIAVLVRAVQELSARVAQLEAKA